MDNNQSTVPIEQEKVLTPQIYKGMFVSALSEAQIVIQKLHDSYSKLVFNADNLPAITEFIENSKKALKKVEEKRQEYKKPILEKGEAIDNGAKLIVNELQPLINTANAHKQKIAAEQEAARLILVEAEKKKKERADLIDNFIIEKTGAIAAAETNETLLYIEKLINLETANESRYGDQLPDLKARIALIRPLIAAQKESVKELTVLEKVADNPNSTDESILEAGEKIDEVKAIIHQQRNNLLETAVGQASAPSASYSQVIPEAIKPARRSWKYRATDLELLYKKSPNLVTLTLNEPAVKALMKEHSENKTLKAGIINGLEFYYDIKY